MLSDEEKKAIERIEDFLTTNKIVSISIDETADSEELTAFISKNEYLAIEFIASMLLKQSKEIEELKKENLEIRNWKYVIDSPIDLDKLKELDLIKIKGKEYVSKDKIIAKVIEIKDRPVKDEFITATQEKLNTIIEIESLLEKE